MQMSLGALEGGLLMTTEREDEWSRKRRRIGNASNRQGVELVARPLIAAMEVAGRKEKRA